MRPALHFTSANGWINDPHGITYRDGLYHAFYQHVPGQTVWEPGCHWGHASGPDLLSLTELPVAIAPGDGDDGIWTGSLVTDDEGKAVVFYTSVSTPDLGVGRVRRATPDDDDGWISWTKGPFVADAPADLDIVAFRDPFVRREGDGWRMFLGAALRDGTAAAVSYVSDDLRTWAYTGVVVQRSTHETAGVWMGALWECPQIFGLEGTSVMVSSIWDADVLHHAGYALGDYADGFFTASNWGRLTYGDSYYAPSLFSDAEERLCLLFWMRGLGNAEEGWAGAHSVPYLLSLRNGRLAAAPHPDVERHRGPRHQPLGSAADVVWHARAGELLVKAGDAMVVSMRRHDDVVTIEASGSRTALPVSGPLRVIIDGPALEVSSAGPVFGCRVDMPDDAAVSVHVDAGRTEVYPLV